MWYLVMQHFLVMLTKELYHFFKMFLCFLHKFHIIYIKPDLIRSRIVQLCDVRGFLCKNMRFLSGQVDKAEGRKGQKKGCITNVGVKKTHYLPFQKFFLPQHLILNRKKPGLSQVHSWGRKTFCEKFFFPC